MNSAHTMSARDIRAPSFALCAGIVAAVTLVRLIGLRFSVVDLYFDESQYWSWAQQPAFGYYSKPPLVAHSTAAGLANRPVPKAIWMTVPILGRSVPRAAPTSTQGPPFAARQTAVSGAVGTGSGTGRISAPPVYRPVNPMPQHPAKVPARPTPA